MISRMVFSTIHITLLLMRHIWLCVRYIAWNLIAAYYDRLPYFMCQVHRMEPNHSLLWPTSVLYVSGTSHGTWSQLTMTVFRTLCVRYIAWNLIAAYYDRLPYSMCQVHRMEPDRSLLWPSSVLYVSGTSHGTWSQLTMTVFHTPAVVSWQPTSRGVDITRWRLQSGWQVQYLFYINSTQ